MEPIRWVDELEPFGQVILTSWKIEVSCIRCHLPEYYWLDDKGRIEWQPFGHPCREGATSLGGRIDV
jgi:hypothetical protein